MILRVNFFCGMRTVQRYESMNSYMRRFLESKHLLQDFVPHIDQGIQNIRYTKLQDDFMSKHTTVLIPSNHPLKCFFFLKNLQRYIQEMFTTQLSKKQKDETHTQLLQATIHHTAQRSTLLAFALVRYTILFVTFQQQIPLIVLVYYSKLMKYSAVIYSLS